MIKRAPTKLKSHLKKKIDFVFLRLPSLLQQSRENQFDSLWMSILISFNVNSPPNQNDRTTLTEQNLHRGIHTADFVYVEFYRCVHSCRKSRAHKRWFHVFWIDFLDDPEGWLCQQKVNAQIQVCCDYAVRFSFKPTKAIEIRALLWFFGRKIFILKWLPRIRWFLPVSIVKQMELSQNYSLQGPLFICFTRFNSICFHLFNRSLFPKIFLRIDWDSKTMQFCSIHWV